MEEYQLTETMKIMSNHFPFVNLNYFRTQMIKELVNRKYEVYIVAEILKFEDELEAMGCHLINIDIGRHGTNPLSDFKLMRQYKKILKQIKPDFVLSYNIKPNVYGGMACKSIKTKFMPNITGLGTALEYPGLMQKITITLSKIGLKKADVVFFQNSENMSFFEKYKILSKKTKMVLLPGSGVDLKKHQLIDYPNDKVIKFLYINDRFFTYRTPQQCIPTFYHKYVKWKKIIYFS